MKKVVSILYLLTVLGHGAEYKIHKLEDENKLLIYETLKGTRVILIEKGISLHKFTEEKIDFKSGKYEFSIFRPRPSIVTAVSSKLVDSSSNHHSDKAQVIVANLKNEKLTVEDAYLALFKLVNNNRE